MNVEAMIRRQGGRVYNITRVVEDGIYSDSDGSFLPGEAESIEVLASVQPLTAEEVVSIPEGDRTRERFKFFSASPLKAVNETLLRKGDRVDLDGVAYEVESVTHWPNYAKAIIARVNTDGVES